MILFKRSGHLKNRLNNAREKNQSIGFVPTMGALHDGHISLVRQSKSQAAITVCSIFVNPTQFNNSSDFEKYPTSIPDDIHELEKAGCDLLFLPSVNEIYPEGVKELDTYDLGYLENILEGKYRPGHFQGVCNVVDRLLDIVSPDKLFLGQKDYQQVMIIDKMISMRTGGRPRIEVIGTLREKDGLAMSSRNRRLNPGQRQKAPAIFEELSRLSGLLKPGDNEEAKKEAKRNLEQKGFVVDYIEVADSLHLKPVENWDGNRPLVILAAAFLDDIRLIDNIIYKP